MNFPFSPGEGWDEGGKTMLFAICIKPHPALSRWRGVLMLRAE